MGNLRESIAELANVRPGWLDGEGVAISPEAIKTASDVVFFAGDGVGRAFPTPDGGVHVDWLYEGEGIYLTVDPGEPIFVSHASASGDVETKEFGGHEAIPAAMQVIDFRLGPAGCAALEAIIAERLKLPPLTKEEALEASVRFVMGDCDPMFLDDVERANAGYPRLDRGGSNG